jgi:hypothetical protein
MKDHCLTFVVKYFYWCTDQHSALCYTYRFLYQYYHSVKSIQISFKICHFFMAFYGKEWWIRKIHSRVTFVFYLTKQVRQVRVVGISNKILARIQKVQWIIKWLSHFLNYKLYLQNKTSCYSGEEWRRGKDMKHCLRRTYVQFQL